MPELLCYGELATLELQNNCIDRIAEQRYLSALTSLDMSANLLQHVSGLQRLRLLVRLTELQLTCNAMEEQPGWALLLRGPWHHSGKICRKLRISTDAANVSLTSQTRGGAALHDRGCSENCL